MRNFAEFTYRPEIDGLRALAVLLVVLFHLNLAIPGGYVGVDIFFVISGYLISRLIIKDIVNDRFSLFGFWERRIRRIFPALFVVMAVTLVAGYFLLLPWDYEDLGRSVLAQALFGSNFHFWSESGYFDAPAETKPLLHTWSLSVEEQFYLLFPALVLFFMHRSPARLRIALVILWIFSLTISIFGVYHFPSSTFYLLHTRAWELLTGALLAVFAAPEWRSRVPAETLSAIGLAVILYASLSFDGTTPFPGAAALLPCLGTAAFIAANESRLTTTGRIMTWRPIVFIGLISYSLYLWHWPAIAVANRIVPGDLDRATAYTILLGSLLVATLSWQFIERPFRQKKRFGDRKRILGGGLAAIIVAIVLGGALDLADGIPGRVPEAVLEVAERKRNPQYRKNTTLQQLETGNLISFGPTVTTPAEASFLLWGDSHAIAMAPGIARLAEHHGISGLAALRAGTPPMLGVWIDHAKIGRSAIDYNQAVVDFVRRHNIRNVLIIGRWRRYMLGDSERPLHGVVIKQDDSQATGEGARRAFIDGLTQAVSALSDIGTRVYLMHQVPLQRVDVPRELADRLWRGTEFDAIGISREQHVEDQSLIWPALASLERLDVQLIDPSPMLFNEAGEAILVHEGQSLYLDEDHISDAGAYYLQPMLQPIFEQMARIRSIERADPP